MAVLISTYQGKESTHALPEKPGEEFTIGRSPKCNLSIPEDNTLSTLHCRILPTPEGYVIEDNHSTNGLFKGSQRITREPMTVGAKFRAGAVNLIFVQSILPASVPPTAGGSEQPTTPMPGAAPAPAPQAQPAAEEAPARESSVSDEDLAMAMAAARAANGEAEEECGEEEYEDGEYEYEEGEEYEEYEDGEDGYEDEGYEEGEYEERGEEGEVAQQESATPGAPPAGGARKPLKRASGPRRKKTLTNTKSRFAGTLMNSIMGKPSSRLSGGKPIGKKRVKAKATVKKPGAPVAKPAPTPAKVAPATVAPVKAAPVTLTPVKATPAPQAAPPSQQQEQAKAEPSVKPRLNKGNALRTLKNAINPFALKDQLTGLDKVYIAAMLILAFYAGMSLYSWMYEGSSVPAFLR